MSGMPEKPLIVTPTEEDLNKIRGYKVSLWGTFKNYECIYCQYSTLWIEKMQKHQAKGEHPWAFPGQNPPGLGSTSDEAEY